MGDILFEEAEITDDDRFWVVVLSYKNPISAGGVGRSMFVGDRGYKVFKLLAETGEIRSVKNLSNKKSAGHRPGWRVPYSRPGVRGVARTVRQQGTRLAGLRRTVGFRPWKEEPGSGCDPGSRQPLTASGGRCLWDESHSDVFATWRWACEAVRTANCLRTHLPAVFAVQQSMPYALSTTAEG